MILLTFCYFIAFKLLAKLYCAQLLLLVAVVATHDAEHLVYGVEEGLHRLVVGDAYNKENVLHFYEKNGFKFLYSTESLEKEANHIPEDEHLESRMMYLDLLGYIR